MVYIMMWCGVMVRDGIWNRIEWEIIPHHQMRRDAVLNATLHDISYLQ